MDHYMIVLAVIIDSLIGDPRSAFHPVALIGNLISYSEKILLAPIHTAARKKISGAVLVITVLFIVYGCTYLVMEILSAITPWAAFLGGAAVLSFAISPRSLAEAAREVAGCLSRGDVQTARHMVGQIVGRDTAKLDSAEITRAAVETTAENIVDGIVSPLFYAALGGAPLAFLYRAVNTMDSMLGYKNDKYKDFGMAAARIDDLFNYIPARITGALIIFAAWLLRYDASGAFKTICQDAAKHPSPNSGLAEAGVAGALGVRLGGLNFYGGTPSFRDYMGKEKNLLTPIHIQQTIYIMYLATAMFAGLIFIVKQV